MTSPRFVRLEDVVADPLFPDADLALRRGRHVDADDLALYTFLTEARAYLEAFYERFGAELVHKPDGYFYLLPTSDKLGKRYLRPIEMLVGQAMALLYLDPRTVEHGGTVTRDDVLGQLASVLGTDDLVRAFFPGKKKIDERVAQEGVRARVNDAMKKLASLGFAATDREGRTKLGPALLRFAEPARLSEPSEAVLARLAAEGELLVTGDEHAFDDDHDEDALDHDGDDETTSPTSEPPEGASEAHEGDARADGEALEAVPHDDDESSEASPDEP